MPYEVVRRGSKWVTKKKGLGGKVLGTHDTRKKAIAQMQAVQIAEKEGK